MTPEELKTITQCSPQRFSTANGVYTCTEIATCKVPHLGPRRCYVMDQCSPLISVGEDIEEYGNIFYWDSTGPIVEMPDGQTIRLDMSINCPTPTVPDEFPAQQCTVATKEIPHGDGSICQPADMTKWDAPVMICQASNESGAPTKAPKQLDEASASGKSANLASRMARQELANGGSDGMRALLSGKPVPKLQSTTVGRGHDAWQQAADQQIRTANEPVRPGGDHQTAEVPHQRHTKVNKTAKRLLTMAAYSVSSTFSQKFFVDIISGSGRLSAAIRANVIRCLEVDLTKQGGTYTSSSLKSLKSFVDGLPTQTVLVCGLASRAVHSVLRGDTVTAVLRHSEA